MSDNELGAFMRSRREAVTPAEVGLRAGPRRRTPGLRRAELATLAGVSVEYLTRLEQGRDRHPSPQVLGALADALRLSAHDRGLLRLAAKAAAGGGLMCPTQEPPARTVQPTVAALLDRLEPTAAVLLNRLSDALAWTDGYARLVEPLGLLTGEPPNLVRFVFTDPRARVAFPDWDQVADEQLAAVRLESLGADPLVKGFFDELTVTAGAPFTERLRSPVVAPGSGDILRLGHPDVGTLRLTHETLTLPCNEQRLLVYLPADAATAAALDQLNGQRRGTLRAVTG
ncbi:helix-turn-helix transcriptional regulator [Saccharomonospora sp. NPDC046836]|uniref:helix-turn-helix domain-containing protein n=1 Tax=Saccharomonospora sp. NPDC046836 TaxID=3156921 RepID=UPI00340D3E74